MGKWMQNKEEAMQHDTKKIDIENKREFNAKNALKAGMLSVVAINRMKLKKLGKLKLGKGLLEENIVNDIEKKGSNKIVLTPLKNDNSIVPDINKGKGQLQLTPRKVIGKEIVRVENEGGEKEHEDQLTP